ncbi:MAG: hypothetical protein VR72_15025 [Clostridiaceae bacterium BRH_c20a]|nr:MAG: hypothetical protein VR72_15025 [Clostridiaceae bacterium BRH_c20a]
MKVKVIVILLMVILLLPSAAFASFDEYGYNAEANIFNGTLENWDNFIFGNPASPYDQNGTDVEFLVRKWSKGFDNAMFNGQPWVDGAWQQAHMYTYLSGEQLGWTHNTMFKMVYSSKPITGALEIPITENVSLWLIQYKEWFIDPIGNEIEITDSLNIKAIPPSLGDGKY